ncbi:MAG: DUF433 domain-containing protein [Planctomycetota bacterium]
MNALLERITVRPDVFGGKPIIRDMRISVDMVLGLLAQGVSTGELLDEFKELEHDDVLACIAFAKASLAGESLSAVQLQGDDADKVAV